MFLGVSCVSAGLCGCAQEGDFATEKRKKSCENLARKTMVLGGSFCGAFRLGERELTGGSAILVRHSRAVVRAHEVADLRIELRRRVLEDVENDVCTDAGREQGDVRKVARRVHTAIPFSSIGRARGKRSQLSRCVRIQIVIFIVHVLPLRVVL